MKSKLKLKITIARIDLRPSNHIYTNRS